MSVLNPGRGSLITSAPAAFINVAYGMHSANRLDVYLPPSRNETRSPALILIHGGGWTGGSRHNLHSYLEMLKARMPDYAIFNLDYRLVRSHLDFPHQESDIKEAIDFIAAHALDYQIDPGKIAILGVSAGAHLGLLQAYKNHSRKIAAVVDFFGPTDLHGMYTRPWNPMIPHLMQSLLNGTPETKPSTYYQASPVNFISDHTPPTLIFHGRQDYMVDISQSELLHQKLEYCKVPNRFVVYNHAGHGWDGHILNDSFERIQFFLKKFL